MTDNDNIGELTIRKRWYTPRELATAVGVSRQTVIKWINEGDLEARRTTGGHWRIPARVITGIDPVKRLPVRI